MSVVTCYNKKGNDVFCHFIAGFLHHGMGCVCCDACADMYINQKARTAEFLGAHNVTNQNILYHISKDSLRNPYIFSTTNHNTMKPITVKIY